MKVLLILNDAPYGSEKTYNALRLAMALQKEQPQTEIYIFLLADSVTAALPVQVTPQGYYNIERMLKAVIGKGGQVKTCGACSEARGIQNLSLLEGVEISTMSQLAQWTAGSDKVLVF
ncbi:MAG: hypothetical protein EPO43_05855 [Rugosibacter sp.]|nr:MAG: hypothetical protein EPO43_05855 [Rugosibacter sp.]